MRLVEQFREALARFDGQGAFDESAYGVLRALLGRGLRYPEGQGDLLDGLTNLFFERHLMDPARRKELLAMDEDELERAVRHRFRQVVADAQEDHRPFHALSPHVRQALERQRGSSPPNGEWPISIQEAGHFVSARVEQAVVALWREQGALPTVSGAAQELLRRYAAGGSAELAVDVPEAVRMRLDGQKLAAGILRLLTGDEKDLLRHVLEGGSVESWAGEHGCSRATAYRLMSRLKTVCRLEFAERSNGTQLEALQALRGELGPRSP